MVALLVVFTILVFLTLDFVVTTIARRRMATAVGAPRLSSPGSPTAALAAPLQLDQVPADAHVAPSHVWVRALPSGAVRAGVDGLLLTLLGGVEVLYPLPKGAVVRRDGPLVMARHQNRALKIRSPIDGVVTAVNQEVTQDPPSLPADVFDKGWIYEITPSRLSSATAHMLSGKQAQEWLLREVSRLRDLVVELSGAQALGTATLPDGGLLPEDLGRHILERVDDEEWEHLVAAFFGGAQLREPEAVGSDIGVRS